INYYCVVAVDAVGNRAYAFDDIVIDLTAPQISSAAATPEIISIALGGETDITATITDANPDSWTITIKESSSLTIIREFSGVGTAVNAVWDGRDEFGASQADGSYEIIVAAFDLAGNTSESTISVALDSTAPVVSFISPEEGAAVSGVSANIVMEVLEDNGIAAVLLYIDGAFDSQATQTATSTWSATIYPHLLGEGPRALSAVATDGAGNQSATTTINITVDNLTPNPPTNLQAISDENGDILLTWDPPTTNTDGSALTDLAGYNVYMMTEVNRCEPVTAVLGGADPVCTPGTSGHSVDSPALVFNGVEYNDNPFGGEGPVWLDIIAPGLGFTLMPLSDSSLVVSGKSVFGFMLELNIAARSGLTPGTYRTTVYTQASHLELADWLKTQTSLGNLDPVSSSFIVAHTTACFWDVAADHLTSESFPLDAISRFDVYRLNVSIIKDLFFIHTHMEHMQAGAAYTVTTTNDREYESVFSNIVNIQ
ncbi:MAG TPA: Ig-like domain-containing protein, partial [bacterium]|nr:Ig-like domain-containing protein [bacterium]